MQPLVNRASRRWQANACASLPSTSHRVHSHRYASTSSNSRPLEPVTSACLSSLSKAHVSLISAARGGGVHSPFTEGTAHWLQRCQRAAAASTACFATAAILVAGPACWQAQAQPSSECAEHGASIALERVQHANLLADVAGLFGGSFEEEKDPINAFTLYGTIVKKFLIEVLDGEKVMARKRGFTVNTCTGVVEETLESPQFQALPVGDKMRAGDNTVCRKAESTELKEACGTACTQSCTISIDRYAKDITERTGYALDDKEKSRLLKSCNRNCNYECGKPGKSSAFSVPYRR